MCGSSTWIKLIGDGATYGLWGHHMKPFGPSVYMDIKLLTPFLRFPYNRAEGQLLDDGDTIWIPLGIALYHDIILVILFLSFFVKYEWALPCDLLG